MQTKILEISPQELKQKLDTDESVLLLDVREPSEYDIVHLEGARLIPLNTLPQHIDSLQQNKRLLSTVTTEHVASMPPPTYTKTDSVMPKILQVVSISGQPKSIQP